MKILHLFSLLIATTLALALPAASECTGNCEDGVGEYRYADGDVYDGEWVDGKREGIGTYTEPEGDVYIGEWVDGETSGLGKLTRSNGDIYEGQSANNRGNGKGTYTWSDGRVYVGDFQESKRHGYGTFTWPSGDIYVGEFENNLRSGFGIYTFPSGNVYEGQWADGKRNGRGILTLADGTRQSGLWRDNRLVVEMDIGVAETQPSPETLPPALVPQAPTANPSTVQSAWIIASGVFFVVFFVAANLLLGPRFNGFVAKLVFATLASLGSGCVLFLLGITAGVNLIAIPIVGALTLALTLTIG